MTITNKCQGTVHTTQCATVLPNPELQALIDKANDKRSIWTKTGDFFSGAWEGTKRVAEASWNDPGNTGIGVAKGVGNLPSDLWNLAVLGSKYVGPIPSALQADTLNYAAMQSYQRGDIATANALAGRASEMMQAGYASDIFELKGDAQKGGSVLSMLVPVGAIAKGAGTAAKVVRGGKALDSAADVADVAKAADGAADAAKVGDGVVVKAKEKPSSSAKKEQVKKNKRDGTKREEVTKKELKDKNPDASVQREQYLRDKDGNILKDPLTGEGRRVDHVVIQDGKVIDMVETTSNTADKAAQIAKENRIIDAGGNFVRDRTTGELVPIGETPIRINRRD